MQWTDSPSLHDVRFPKHLADTVTDIARPLRIVLLAHHPNRCLAPRHNDRSDFSIRLFDSTFRFDFSIRLFDSTFRFDFSIRLFDSTFRFDFTPANVPSPTIRSEPPPHDTIRATVN
ncbi:hypothetical protein PG990_002479 [Apiospora arundinis]